MKFSEFSQIYLEINVLDFSFNVGNGFCSVSTFSLGQVLFSVFFFCSNNEYILGKLGRN